MGVRSRKRSLAAVGGAMSAIAVGGRPSYLAVSRRDQAAELCLRQGAASREQGPLGVTPGKIKHVWLIILEN